MADQVKRNASFPVNEHGWVLLFQVFGKKTLLRAESFTNRGWKSDENNQHRMHNFEFEGGVKVRSKLIDTSEFAQKA